MFKKQIKQLEKTKAQYQARLDSIHDADADPNVKAIYQSDIQYEIVKIDAAIAHENYMLPFKYTLAAVIVVVLGFIIYLI